MKIKQTPEDFRVIERSEPSLSDSGPFYVYVLRKKKLTTPEAIRELARANDLRVEAFAYAGLKDRQGVTEQIISVTGKPIRYESPQIKLRFLGRSHREVQSTDSEGNRFEITLRRLRRHEAQQLVATAHEIRSTGVPNYFDSQRFGCLRHGQGFVARLVIHGEFEEALRRLIASKSRFDTKDTQFKGYLRKHWGQWRDLADKHRRSLYSRLFSYLADHPEDFRGALKLIPLGTKLIHLCAYQSFLWNETLRRFLEEELSPPAESLPKSGESGGAMPASQKELEPSDGRQPVNDPETVRVAPAESAPPSAQAREPDPRSGASDATPKQPRSKPKPASWQGTPYECGWLIFPNGVPSNRASALKSLSIPLPAASTRPKDPRIARALDRTLKHEGLALSDLGVKNIPGFLFKEEPRPAMLVPTDLSIREPEPDDLNKGFLKVRLSFSLPRGAYGSLILKRLLAEPAPPHPRQREPRGVPMSESAGPSRRSGGRGGSHHREDRQSPRSERTSPERTSRQTASAKKRPGAKPKAGGAVRSHEQREGGSRGGERYQASRSSDRAQGPRGGQRHPGSHSPGNERGGQRSSSSAQGPGRGKRYQGSRSSGSAQGPRGGKRHQESRSSGDEQGPRGGQRHESFRSSGNEQGPHSGQRYAGSRSRGDERGSRGGQRSSGRAQGPRGGRNYPGSRPRDDERGPRGEKPRHGPRFDGASRDSGSRRPFSGSKPGHREQRYGGPGGSRPWGERAERRGPADSGHRRPKGAGGRRGSRPPNGPHERGKEPGQPFHGERGRPPSRPADRRRDGRREGPAGGEAEAGGEA